MCIPITSPPQTKNVYYDISVGNKVESQICSILKIINQLFNGQSVNDVMGSGKSKKEKIYMIVYNLILLLHYLKRYYYITLHKLLKQ